MTIEFATFTDAEESTVHDIACRAQELFTRAGSRRANIEIQMDISAVHAKCPIRLEALLAADDFNFIHDVMGIYRHLNRETGELENCFRPRFAAYADADVALDKPVSDGE